MEKLRSYRAMPQSPAEGFPRRSLVAALVLLPFAVAIFSSFPLCPMASLLGTPCPGCGLTRATLAALGGDFSLAFHIHPLVYLMVPIYALAVISLLISYLFGVRTLTGGPALAPNRSGDVTALSGSRRVDRAVTWIAGVCLVALLGVWLARFAGYFGGPVPVETLSDWTARLLKSR